MPGTSANLLPLPEGPVWKRVPNLFSLLVILVLAVNYFSAFCDLDFSWQVRTGERIAHGGGLLPDEAFTYTIFGRPVSQFEWLYELILWLLWSGFGFGGLKLLRTVLVAAPLVLLALRLRRDGVRWHGIALALFAAIAVVSPAWNLRPMYCTTIGLLLVSGWLHDHCAGRRRLDWRLPVVMLLWGNLHPGVITGQGLLIGAIAWEWINRRVRLNAPLDPAACWRLTLVGGLGLAATFISPAPVARLLLPLQPQLAHPIQRSFAEMRPLASILSEQPHVVLLAYLLAGIVLLTLVVRFRHYRLWEVALLLGLAGLANVAVRCLQDWTLLMLALAVPHLAVLLRQAVLMRRQQPWQQRSWGFGRLILRAERSCKHVLNSPLCRFQAFWPTAALGLLTVASLIPPVSRRMPVQNASEWPAPALDWIEAEGLHGRFFAPPDYGAYVTWRLRDDARCYVDTRGFLFPPELLEDALYVPQLGPDWRERLERVFAHGTDYFLLETTGPRGQLWASLRPHVDRPLYLDGQTVLLSATQVRGGLERMDAMERAERKNADLAAGEVR